MNYDEKARAYYLKQHGHDYDRISEADEDALSALLAEVAAEAREEERERLRGVASKQPDGHNAAMAVLADLLIAEDQTPTDAQRAYGELVADRLEQGAHRGQK